MTGPRGPYRVMRPELSQAMARLYGLKGDAKVDALDSLSPVLMVGALDDTPYGALGKPVAGRTSQAAPGAGLFRHLGVRPGAGVLLQVRRVIVRNNGGGSASFRLVLMPHSLIQSGTTVEQLYSLLDLDASGAGGAVIAPTQRSSLILRYDAASLGTAGIIVPDQVVASGSNFEWTFPADVAPTLVGGDNFGGSSTGTGFLSVVCTTSNAAIEAAFHGREFPVPG